MHEERKGLCLEAVRAMGCAVADYDVTAQVGGIMSTPATQNDPVVAVKGARERGDVTGLRTSLGGCQKVKWQLA